MNEYETRSEHITPALKAAGWGVIEGSKIEYEYSITQGRIMGAGKSVGDTLAESLYPQKLAALDALKKSVLHQAFGGWLMREPGGETYRACVGLACLPPARSDTMGAQWNA